MTKRTKAEEREKHERDRYSIMLTKGGGDGGERAYQAEEASLVNIAITRRDASVLLRIIIDFSESPLHESRLFVSSIRGAVSGRERDSASSFVLHAGTGRMDEWTDSRTGISHKT